MPCCRYVTSRHLYILNSTLCKFTYAEIDFIENELGGCSGHSILSMQVIDFYLTQFELPPSHEKIKTAGLEEYWQVGAAFSIHLPIHHLGGKEERMTSVIMAINAAETLPRRPAQGYSSAPTTVDIFTTSSLSSGPGLDVNTLCC